jgi:branched-subunit amino acid aminotransferase/4-amino-4-deoxychorismate lyase
MQLLDLALAGAGRPVRRAAVRVPDVGSFAAVFVSNARGIAPVGQIDGQCLPQDTEVMRTLAGLYDSAAWDPI